MKNIGKILLKSIMNSIIIVIVAYILMEIGLIPKKIYQ